MYIYIYMYIMYIRIYNGKLDHVCLSNGCIHQDVSWNDVGGFQHC